MSIKYIRVYARRLHDESISNSAGAHATVSSPKERVLMYSNYRNRAGSAKGERAEISVLGSSCEGTQWTCYHGGLLSGVALWTGPTGYANPRRPGAVQGADSRRKRPASTILFSSLLFPSAFFSFLFSSLLSYVPAAFFSISCSLRCALS